MTRKGTRNQSVVERLIEQQRQYQDWLDRLDAEAAGAAPSHVAQRVRADYAVRLKEVTQELSEHEDGIRQALAEAETRSEGLTKQHADRTDELAEARLRRQVGEFDDAQFEEIASRCKTALAELTKELATVERDIDRYEEILTLIKGVGQRRPAPTPEPRPEPAAAAPAAGEARGRLSEPGRRVSQPQMAVDELAFLRSADRSRRRRPRRSREREPPKAEPVRAEPPTVEPPRMEVVEAEPAESEPPIAEVPPRRRAARRRGRGAEGTAAPRRWPTGGRHQDAEVHRVRDDESRRRSGTARSAAPSCRPSRPSAWRAGAPGATSCAPRCCGGSGPCSRRGPARASAARTDSAVGVARAFFTAVLMAERCARLLLQVGDGSAASSSSPT